MRRFPKVPLTPCPPSYARFLGEGWDSVQETYDAKLAPHLVTVMEEAQAHARKSNSRRRMGLAPLRLGDVDYRMRAVGVRGARWVLECEDHLLIVAAPGTSWPLSIRYLSHALWRTGDVAELRRAALASLQGYVSQLMPDQMRVTRADYCFDFHSPAFTREHRPGSIVPCIVCHRSCKLRDRAEFAFDCEGIGIAKRGQTATAGSKAYKQVQIYDKSAELTKTSGKEWFKDLWAREVDGEVLDSDVHRLEVRLGSEFFKERNLRTPEEVFAAKKEIVVEALYSIRLTMTMRDTNRRRRPIHPLWSEAIRRCGAKAMLPLGRRVTGQREALVDQLRRTLAGTLRSQLALKHGEYTRAQAIEELNAVIGVLENDEKHESHFEQALLRYADVGKARS